jgi:hypothetical protein
VQTVEWGRVEAELCRIAEVTAARVVADGAGRAVEVHVLATPDKHAKQIVRDIQSVAMATFGVELDRRIISVVQLDRAATASLRDPSRIVVDSVVTAREGLQCSVAVQLRRDSERAAGKTESTIATSAILRGVAQATLEALRVIEPNAERLDVEHAAIVRLGDRSVAVVSVVFLVPPYEEVVTGSAVVREMGDHDAVARAVLDATNRRLAQLPS